DDKKKKEFGGDLVVRVLRDGVERTFADVTDFTVTKNGAVVVYTVSSKKEETNGVYALRLDRPGSAGTTWAQDSSLPEVLLSGKGKYAKLTWDDRQVQLAFISDRDDQVSKPAKFSLYRWDLKST